MSIKNKIISEILNDFDFERVYTCMLVLNWEWAVSLGEDQFCEMAVPSKGEIIDTARDLLNSAYNQKIECSTGGFTARYEEYEDGEYFLTLTFELDSCTRKAYRT
ncbi:MAG: hypothetical protein HC836_24245 [Richelia sp. RM2_1_2]|nr:hypothetical protein [Richelia sp. RM2_1_2]